MTTPIYTESCNIQHKFNDLEKGQKVKLEFSTKELALAKLLSIRVLCTSKTKASNGTKIFTSGIEGRTVWYQRVK